MYCPHCGTQNLDAANLCIRCGGQIQTARRASIEDDPSMRILLPIGRSPYAIAAGYAGLFAVIPFLAPIALVLGILAIRHIKRDPKLHGLGRAWFGLVMGILGTLPLLLIVVLLIAESLRGR
jgi:Domain of unknown function (DUF4190)/zinc-ribbon domain